ncbi:MAG: hypothetical protein ACKOYN_01685, partial [Planctomycetota bacterium]
FARSERATVAAARSVVRVPRTFADLRGIAGRKRLGSAELDAIAPLRADQRAAGGTMGAVLAAAAEPGARVVSAAPDFDARGAGLAVRLFYAAERFNPYHRESAPNGSGTYCVNAAGRARWSEFPKVIADDGFVERQFARSERATVAAARSVVRVPRTFADLRGIAGRKRLGSAELDAIAPLRADQRAAGGTMGAVVAALLPRPWLWPALAVWTSAKALERLDRGRVARLAGQQRWQQDRSSRG